MQMLLDGSPQNKNSSMSPGIANHGGSGLGEGLRTSFATESCIKVNRTAVKESRPPFNDGDESNKSSANSEPEISIGDDNDE
jgi:hypothetical protein